MNGINAMFHWGSALATVLLVVLLLRQKKQRDFLRRLLSERRLPTGARRVTVEAPGRLLKSFADAIGVPFERGDGADALFDAPARIDATPLLELHLSYGIKLIRCTSTTEIFVGGPAPDSSERAKTLGAALGDKVKVIIST